MGGILKLWLIIKKLPSWWQLKYVVIAVTPLMVWRLITDQSSDLHAKHQVADSLMQSLVPLICKLLPANDYPQKEVMAIVYPELLRYSPALDKIEQEVNRRLYAVYNIEGVRTDFSMGLFQMKPSFAERIEGYFRAALPKDELTGLLTYPYTDSISVRSTRLARLELPYWQLIYLKGFHRIVHHKYPQIKQYPPRKRVCFMALAYNVGFYLPEAKLWPWQEVKYFPHGNAAKFLQQENTHSYADLSSEFFAIADSNWCNKNTVLW
jgi:hypothetical protein